MKMTQKLIVIVESIKFIVRFEDLDPILLPIALRLEKEGDIDGKIIDVVHNCGLTMCVMMCYADGRQGPSKKIFGYPEEVLLNKQYK